MNFLRALNKEQWTALGAAILGAFLLAGGLAGGVAPTGEIPTSGAPYDYERPGLTGLELPDEAFERYWQGRNPMPEQAVSRLALPYLKAPEPREADLAAPLFRPGPTTDAYNRLSTKAKYPVLEPGAPAAPEPLPAADLQALLKLEEPEVKSRADRRHERERALSVVTLKTGIRYEGEMTVIGDTVRMKVKDGGAVLTLKRSDIAELKQSLTFEQEYQERSRKAGAAAKPAEERHKLAVDLLQWGMVPEAREELRRAIELRKDYADAILLRVQLDAEAGDYDAAMALLEEGLAAGASPADLQCEAGRLLRLLGLPGAAALAYEKAVEASPRHAKAKAGLARSLLEDGQTAAAEAVASDFATKLLSSADIPAASKAEALVVRATALLRKGAPDKAQADFAEALKLDPQNAEAMNGQGVLQALEGNWAAAGGSFAQAIRANQYRTEAWTNLATLFLLAGRWADAEGVYLAAQQRDPVSAEAIAGQGVAQLLAGRGKDAAATLERALQLDPRHRTALTALGHHHLVQGADDAALKSFVEALRADPWHLPSYAGAAAAYLRSARGLAAQADAVKDETRAAALSRQAAERRLTAEALLRTVKDHDPNRPDAWIALGCAYAGMGRADEARQALRMAASLRQDQNLPASPLIHFALGYVEYYHGAGDEPARVEAALAEFATGAKLREAAKDPFSQRLAVECEAAREAVEEWKVSAVRFDDRFERDTSKTVGPAWLENDGRYGIEVGIENVPGKGGRVKFAGRQAIADWGVTTLSREIPPEGFHLLEATLMPEKVEKAEYGLALYYSETGTSRVGFHVGFDVQGRLRFHASAADPRDLDRKDMLLGGGWTEIKAAVPAKDQVHLRVVKSERGRQVLLTVYVQDVEKGEWIPVRKDIPISQAAAKSGWRVAVFV
ncbi:MAG TPA: tetratricopeptide repeat protein, partial [Planctomycetota bacterium]|nr:tetratricopeptide repeat protein [Planctomycetota bacterium]